MDSKTSALAMIRVSNGVNSASKMEHSVPRIWLLLLHRRDLIPVAGRGIWSLKTLFDLDDQQSRGVWTVSAIALLTIAEKTHLDSSSTCLWDRGSSPGLEGPPISVEEPPRDSLGHSYPSGAALPRAKRMTDWPTRTIRVKVQVCRL